jgi:uncharacterized membrane protein YgcG
MGAKRLARHLTMTHWRVRSAFPAGVCDAIDRAIRESESRHRAEIRFAVEGALDIVPLFQGRSARERAIDVFSHLRIWDTEDNNGVLIYLLLADRTVEIVADRGVHAKVGTTVWEGICREMEPFLQRGEFEAGVVHGIQAVTGHLARHFPARDGDRNELPDEPVILGRGPEAGRGTVDQQIKTD